MSTSETDLLNDALGQIGAGSISAINEDSPNARWCRVYYDKLRQQCLRSHHWNFAEARAELAQDAIAPEFGWTYAYTLPSDYLKLKQFNGTDWATYFDPSYPIRWEEAWKIEGDKIMTNAGRVFIVYVKDVTNPALWDPLFYDYVALRLASKLAMAVGKDSAKASALLEMAMGLSLPLAAAVDGQEGSIQPYRSDDLTWGRY